SRRRHTRWPRDWSSDVCSSDLFDAVEKPVPLIESAVGAPYMFATLESLIALQPQRVLCSHGKTTSPQLVQDNLSYLREIEQRCRSEERRVGKECRARWREE